MSRTSRSKGFALVAVAGAAALVLSACGSSDDTASTTTPAATTTAATTAAATSEAMTSAADTGAATGEATGSGSAEASGSGEAVPDEGDWCQTLKDTFGDITGKSVDLYTSIVQPEDTPYKDAFKVWEDCTGAKLNYTGDKNFEAQLKVRTQAGNPPDIALVPQPGLLRSLVESSGAVKQPSELATKNVETYYGQLWKELGTVNGQFYGTPNSANVKSFVWYSPKQFKADGYTVPTTWDELIALSDKIAAAGKKPWCAGIGSGEATGWPATDWLEDVVLRTAGPDVYDQWVNHDVKFSDQPIADALAQVGSILKNEKYVNGGFGDVSTIATTTFQDGGQPILKGDCYLHRQASFYQANWPKGTKVAEDGDVYAFYFPGKDTTTKPVLIGGEFVAAFADRPEVQSFQAFTTFPAYSNARAKGGNFISANKGLKVENVDTDINKLSVQLIQDPNAITRFDASDLMPAAVGSDAEWKQLTAWITGQDDATTLANIDQAWPSN